MTIKEMKKMGWHFKDKSKYAEVAKTLIYNEEHKEELQKLYKKIANSEYFTHLNL